MKTGSGLNVIFEIGKNNLKFLGKNAKKYYFPGRFEPVSQR